MLFTRLSEYIQGISAPQGLYNQLKIATVVVEIIGIGGIALATIRERSQRRIKYLANGVLERRPVELSRAELQRAVERQFPLSLEALVTLEFSEPCVRLDCGDDRMGLELSISAEIMGKMTPASRWLLTGELSYKRDSGEFFLFQPDIRAVPSTTGNDNTITSNRIRKFLVADIIGSLLSDLPVYQLKAWDSKQALARKFLHSLSIRDGKLAIWLHIE